MIHFGAIDKVGFLKIVLLISFKKWTFPCDVVIIGAQKSAHFSRTGLCQQPHFTSHFKSIVVRYSLLTDDVAAVFADGGEDFQCYPSLELLCTEELVGKGTPLKIQ